MTPVRRSAMRVGVISDTHGHLDPSVAKVFAGVDHILHAGDVVRFADLVELRTIAPVTAVAGNCDVAAETGPMLKEVETLTLAGVSVTVVHDLARLPASPSVSGLIVHGHTHRPEVVERDGTVWLNPGSATWPDGRMAPTVSVVTLDGGRVSASIIAL